MKPRPVWVRRLGVILAVGVGLGFLMAVYAYFQLTADIDTNVFKEPNPLDAQEAERKLGIYRKALAQSERSGFIRLSETEINSYLHQNYFDGPRNSRTNEPAPTVRLLASRMKFDDQDILWYCWVRKKWLGRPVQMVWRREIRLGGAAKQWTFQTKAMSVGKLDVPVRYWPLVSREIGEIDRVFSDDLRWVTNLPALEISTNNLSAIPELRLYTHPVHSASSPQKP